MAQVKGKYILAIGYFMGGYQEARKKADELLFAETGKYFNELEPEGWYNAKWVKIFLDAYVNASSSEEFALVNFGRSIFPNLEQAKLLPSNLKTVQDFVKYEAEYFSDSHKGGDVSQRKFIKITEGEIIIEAVAPGYSSKVYEGVYLGILEMLGVRTGKVLQIKNQEMGDNTSEFKITWKLNY